MYIYIYYLLLFANDGRFSSIYGLEACISAYNKVELGRMDEVHALTLQGSQPAAFAAMAVVRWTALAAEAEGERLLDY